MGAYPNGRQPTSLLFGVALPLTLLMIGCDPDGQDLVEPPLQSAVSGQAAALASSLGESEAMVAVAEHVPSFAGFYFDESGDIEIRITDAEQFPAAEARVKALTSGRYPGATYRFRQADFTFLELARYRADLRDEAFQIPGVLTLGVRESTNRVEVGIASSDAEMAIEAVLRSLGIPTGAVSFVRVAAAGVDSHDLDDAHPDGEVEGGWSIQADGVGRCTLGFAALRESDMEQVFIVNSHCTKTETGYDGGWIRQPSSTGTTFGYEIADPSTWSCFLTSLCRYSDAAMIEASVGIQLGEIARTTTSSGCDQCNPGNEVSHTDPDITIDSRQDYGIENETLHKIGRSTGWTYGAVEDTCTDANVSGWVRLCSDRVDYSRAGGDSGSPVFSYNSSSGRAELRGIHWGYWSNGLGDYDGYMSPLGQIEKDLGDLIVVGIPPSVSIDGPTYLPPGLSCQWVADVSGGVPPYDFAWSGALTGSSGDVNGILYNSDWLHVTVTDDVGGQDIASIYITIDSEAPQPPGCSE